MMRLYDERPVTKNSTFGFRADDTIIDRIRYVSGRVGLTPSLYAHNATLDQLIRDEEIIKQADEQKKSKSK
jgi:hypothetical protein